MDGCELAELIERRWNLLNDLLQLSQQQVEAIESNAMTELMRILSAKQSPLSELTEIADQLRAASHDDPEARLWPEPAMRQRCRQQQDACEQMHLELLAIEAECEATLTRNRDEIQHKLDRVDAGRQVASSYARQESQGEPGGSLDLSSD